MSCYLEEIFNLQDSLNSKFDLSQEQFLLLSEEDRLEWVNKFMVVMIGEAFEVQKACKARWWKQEKDFKGVDHIKEELVDCLHLLVSGMLAIGMSPQEVYIKYRDKNLHNSVRTDRKINE